jgi:integrase
VYQRGGVWWVKYYRNGKPYRESSGSAKEADAFRLLRKRLLEIDQGLFIGPKAEKITVSELADDVLRDYRVNEKDSLDKAERSAKRIKEFFGYHKAHALADCPAEIDKFIEERQKQGTANGTINRELALLNRCFSLGIKKKNIQCKPDIEKLKEAAPRKGFFEYPEFVAVRDASPDWFKTVATFAYYTAWRKEEILNLRWNQVDLDAEEIRLYEDETKGDDGRVIVLDGELFETVRGQWERRKWRRFLVTPLPCFAPTSFTEPASPRLPESSEARSERMSA